VNYEEHSGMASADNVPPEKIGIGVKIKVALVFVRALLQLIREK
jgi:hypothetical protein